MKAVLCIGGLDPAGRAGLLADARAVTAMGCRPLCVATALTFQSSRKADGYHAVSPEILSAQLSPLLRDEAVAAIKVGQLATPELALVVARMPVHVPLVLDTPLRTSSGTDLFPSGSIRTDYEPLLARATLVTPNANEILALSNGSPNPFDAAVQLAKRANAVLLKGGHLAGDRVEDTLYFGQQQRVFSSPRLIGTFRGTGCRLASAIAACLALSDELETAVAKARDWLHMELRGEL